MFDSEREKQLTEFINVMCKLGFSPKTNDILDLVATYIKDDNIKAAIFKDGKPGKEWLSFFIRRNKLILKKASMLSSARKSMPLLFMTL